MLTLSFVKTLREIRLVSKLARNGKIRKTAQQKTKVKHIKWPRRILEGSLTFVKFMECKLFFTHYKVQCKFISYVTNKLLAISKKSQKFKEISLNGFNVKNNINSMI